MELFEVRYVPLQGLHLRLVLGHLLVRPLPQHAQLGLCLLPAGGGGGGGGSPGVREDKAARGPRDRAESECRTSPPHKDKNLPSFLKGSQVMGWKQGGGCPASSWGGKGALLSAHRAPGRPGHYCVGRGAEASVRDSPRTREA